jgi:Acetyltransferase (GNAT) domain
MPLEEQSPTLAPSSGNANLARADALASDLLARLAPVRVAATATAEERAAAFRLRYEAVIDEQWMEADELPDGLEFDELDAKAVQIVAWFGERPIGACRLLFPAPDRLLPTEAAFDIRVEPAGEVVDVGRVTVAREARDGTQRVLAGLLARTWLEMRARGFVHACGAFAAPAVIRLYRGMGFTVTVLAPPRPYWGTLRSPIRFDVPGASPNLIARWSEAARET